MRSGDNTNKRARGGLDGKVEEPVNSATVAVGVVVVRRRRHRFGATKE
jgi:hypothetical protein